MDVPLLFLSHAGAQKDFTWRLYQELLHVGHRAFFDQDALDSLPKGHPFPPRIVQACRGCKMGIVVLSHQYIESVWPMLELEQLTFHNLSSHKLLYPLFYRLHPADLSTEDNLRRWQATWESHALAWQTKVQAVQAASTSSTSHLQISINISSWKEALEKLRYQSGDVLQPHMGDHAYIQAIVCNICKAIPPPRRYLLGKSIRGMDRMQQDIIDLFEQAGKEHSEKICGESNKRSRNSKSVLSLGLWGLGGSGKTTLCKNMVNFYSKDFPGRSCLLELPSKNDEKQLLETMKQVLMTLGRVKTEDTETISSVEEIMALLEEGLRRHQVFLVIDNIWDWTIEMAKQIVSMDYMVGSKIVVTSRSYQVLEELLPWKIVHVPSITEEEAVEVLKSYSCFLHVIPEPEDLKSVARLCFFRKQCHPLLLKVMGAKLRQRGRRTNHERDWKDVISRLQGGPIYDEEEIILEVLGSSLRELSENHQNIFTDLVMCVPYEYKSFLGACKWLSMIHDGFTEMHMRDQLIELEYHGLLEIYKHASGDQISIHDLHKSVARSRSRVVGRDACLFEGSLSDRFSTDKCSNVKYMQASDCTEAGILRVMTHCLKLEIFILKRGTHVLGRVSVQSMRFLRFLELHQCPFLKEIEGWNGTPNLVSIKLCECRFLHEVGNMGCLQKLQELTISGSYRCVPDLTQCSELKSLVFSHSLCLEDLASLGKPPKLQKLDLSCNTNLVDVSTVGTFTALQQLTLRACSRLREFPNINLSKLLSLDLAGCVNLQSIKGGVCALMALEELDLRGCYELRGIPNLTNLVRLKVYEAPALQCVTLGREFFGRAVD